MKPLAGKLYTHTHNSGDKRGETPSDILLCCSSMPMLFSWCANTVYCSVGLNAHHWLLLALLYLSNRCSANCKLFNCLPSGTTAATAWNLGIVQTPVNKSGGVLVLTSRNSCISANKSCHQLKTLWNIPIPLLTATFAVVCQYFSFLGFVSVLRVQN